MPQMRLDKLLADMGVASRKELREIIRAGRVQVDGLAETRPERRLDPDTAAVQLDGKALDLFEKSSVLAGSPAAYRALLECFRPLVECE